MLKQVSLSTILVHLLPPAVLWMVGALVHHLTARVVEDGHFELACSDLLEQEKETDIQLMSNRECWPTPIETGFTIENRQFDC